MPERTCARCAETFLSPEGATGQDLSWCSSCRRSYMREYMREYEAVPCPRCGETMNRRSRQCVACHRAQAPVWIRTHRPCGSCGELFWPHQTNQRFCSARCNARAKSRERYARETERLRGLRPPATGECLWCFGPIAAGRSSNRFCSAACASARHSHWTTWKAPDRSHLPICADCGRLGGFHPVGHRQCCAECQEKRDALRRNSANARRLKAERSGDAAIHWTTVGERDLWKCHICGKKVPKRPGNAADMDGATVDHLVPIVNDGTHTWSNVALAHRSCNLSRGANGEVQLRLVG